jgi:hypothetical protein
VNDDVFDPGDLDRMEQRLEELRVQHRALDERIDRMVAEGATEFQLGGLKREKLRLKDHIAWLAAKMTPDIIA